MKNLIKNPYFWLSIVLVIVASSIVARSKTGTKIADATGKLIPLGGASPATTDAKAV